MILSAHWDNSDESKKKHNKNNQICERSSRICGSGSVC